MEYEPKPNYDLLQRFADCLDLPFNADRLQKLYRRQYEIYKPEGVRMEQYVYDKVLDMYRAQIHFYKNNTIRPNNKD